MEGLSKVIRANGGRTISPEATAITKIEIWPIDVPITDPFVVATGRLTTAHNLVVRVTLAGGAAGYGEIAPFPEVGGEDRTTCHAVATQLAQAAIGQPAARYRQLARQFDEMAATHPASRCGLETALLDALCRHLRIPLWGFWGGADVRPRETDITIPITTLARTLALGQEWYKKGFRLFKTKVGVEVDQDIRRLGALHRALPDIAFIADANQGFTQEACRHFVKEVHRFGGTIRLLEQPVPREDVEGLAALHRDVGVPVAADESVRTLQDALDVVKAQAADVINIKSMKSGLLNAIEIAGFARTAGLRLMIGGMVETRIAMGCSFGLVLGLGGFHYLDLDTPLLLASDPVQGGFRYDGPTLHPWAGPGLDLEMTTMEPITTIQ